MILLRFFVVKHTSFLTIPHPLGQNYSIKVNAVNGIYLVSLSHHDTIATLVVHEAKADRIIGGGKLTTHQDSPILLKKHNVRRQGMLQGLTL